MHAVSLIAAGLVVFVAAHPGHDHVKEARERRAAALNSWTSLSHCQEQMHASGIQQRAIERRVELARHMTRKRSLKGMRSVDAGYLERQRVSYRLRREWI